MYWWDRTDPSLVQPSSLPAASLAQPSMTKAQTKQQISIPSTSKSSHSSLLFLPIFVFSIPSFRPPYHRQPQTRSHLYVSLSLFDLSLSFSNINRFAYRGLALSFSLSLSLCLFLFLSFYGSISTLYLCLSFIHISFSVCGPGLNRGSSPGNPDRQQSGDTISSNPTTRLMMLNNKRELKRWGGAS